jgi:hypothetical protein
MREEKVTLVFTGDRVSLDGTRLRRGDQITVAAARAGALTATGNFRAVVPVPEFRPLVVKRPAKETALVPELPAAKEIKE